jgi:mono/diheme cytochrome c family protein
MKTIWKVLLYTIIGLVVLLIGAFIYFMVAFPAVGKPEDIKVELTDVRIERGKYLFHNVSLCVDCHTPRNWDLLTGPPDIDRLASGNTDDFTEKSGFPGNFYAPNLTPYHLKNWTDGEIFRAITEGVSKDGRPLFPVMPYMNYGKMDKEDIYSIIAYIRTLPEIASDIPLSEPNFPMNLIMKMMPKKAEFTNIPDKSNTLKYGEYVTNAAACIDCHTPMEKGQHIPGMQFAGGQEFNLPKGGKVRSANITPDKSTGIGNWTKQQFIDRFKSFSDTSFTPSHVGDNEYNTIMPWMKYSGMDENDLGAIYDYLSSLKANNNSVVKFEPNK